MAYKDRPKLEAGAEFEIMNSEGRMLAKIVEVVSPYQVKIQERPMKKYARWGKPFSVTRRSFWQMYDAAA